MFLRKLMAAVLPLVMCLALCALFPFLGKTFPDLGFFGYVIQGLLMGLALALLIPLMGGRRRDPFVGLFWVSIVGLAAVMTYQYLLIAGTIQAGIFAFLSVAGRNAAVLVESAFLGFLLTAVLRAGR